MDFVVIGIDPGVKGGIAVLDPDGELLALRDVPEANKQVDVSALTTLMQALCADFGEKAYVVIEKVHSMPKQGVASTFKFGSAFGALQATAFAYGTEVLLVTPGAWKKALGLSQDKKASLSLARDLWPNWAAELRLVKHKDRAEAALIAHFGLNEVFALREALE